jgi:hypothetical protein
MSIEELPPVMGAVLIVAGLALVGVSAWPRAAGTEKTTQVGALIIVVGAFLLGLSIFVSHGKSVVVRGIGHCARCAANLDYKAAIAIRPL